MRKPSGRTEGEDGGQGKKEISGIKWTHNDLLCFFCPERAGAPEHATKTRIVTCFALQSRALLKGVITGEALSVEKDQLKLKIPGVCDPRHLVQCRPGEECVCTSEF